MPTYGKDGHLFGDAVFRAKYWELQNENEEMQIRYSEENGLEIAGGGAKIFLQAEEPENWDAGDWWYQILTDDGGD